MTAAFIHSIQSEWLKKRRTAAAWLVVIGGFFIPAIILAGRLYEFDSLAGKHTAAEAWVSVFQTCWRHMAILLLPFGVILATSLITQLEFRNNTWKQVHTAPQRLLHVFFAKLLVILAMLLQFFILFNIGIYLVVALPALVFGAVPYPAAEIPFDMALKWNSQLFLASLPIVGLQYLISLQFRNFMIPIGVGVGLFVASLVALSWKYSYLIPYTYCSIAFLGNAGQMNRGVNIQYWAVGYFVLFTSLSLMFYLAKKEKG